MTREGHGGGSSGERLRRGHEAGERLQIRAGRHRGGAIAVERDTRRRAYVGRRPGVLDEQRVHVHVVKNGQMRRQPWPWSI